jgi:hypothetical protein
VEVEGEFCKGVEDVSEELKNFTGGKWKNVLSQRNRMSE